MIAPDAGIYRCGGGRLTHIGVERINDSLTVDGIADSLAQACILQILVGTVELQAMRSDAVKEPDFHTRCFLQKRNLRGGDGRHIDLAGLQCDLACIGISNDQYVNGLGGHNAAEVVVKALQYHLIILVPFSQLVGTSAVDRLNSQAQFCTIFFNVILIQDQIRTVCKVRKHRRNGAGRDELHSVVVHHVAGRDITSGKTVVPDGILRVQQTVITGLDVLGSQLFAAVEFNTMLQVESPRAAILGDFPTLSQITNYVVIRTAANQLRIDSTQIDIVGVVHLTIHIVLVRGSGNRNGVLVYGFSSIGGICGRAGFRCGIVCGFVCGIGFRAADHERNNHKCSQNKRKDFFHIVPPLCFYILGAEAPKISISGFHLGIALQSGKRSPKITYFAQRSSSQKMTLFTFSFRPSTLSVVAQMVRQSFVQTAAGSSM